MPKIIYEFDYYEDQELLKDFQRSPDYHSALFDIYNIVRSELKHGEEEKTDHMERLLEEILEMASEVMD